MERSVHGLSSRIASRIDPSAATPLYHQVAAIIRWEIAAGRLAIGARLPSVREVSNAVGVHYHTVRRAWADLDRQGLISVRRGAGARVIRAPAPRQEWSAAPPAADSAARPRVWVVDQSLTTAAHLGTPIRERWEVEVGVWQLEADAPPPGLILSLPAQPGAPSPAERWEAREADCRVLPAAPSPQLLAELQRHCALLGARSVVLVGPPDDPDLGQLARQLPRVGLVARRAAEPPTAPGTLDQVYLVESARWDRLAPADRHHPAVLPLVREFGAGPLSGVAREQGWQLRRA